MDEFLTITCPHCGEEFVMPLDAGEDGETELVTDCEICCRPILITLRLRDGKVVELVVSAS